MTSTEVQNTLRAIFDARDRADMQPTIDAFFAVLAEHTDDPEVLYEVGGAYDTAGVEERACSTVGRCATSGAMTSRSPRSSGPAPSSRGRNRCAYSTP